MYPRTPASGGSAKELVKRLEERAAQLGIRRVTLRSTVTAHLFYLSADYEDAGPAVTSFFGEGLSYPMRKELPKP